MTVNQCVKEIHSAGKKAFIHVDFAEGIGKDRAGLEFLAKQGVDGAPAASAALTSSMVSTIPPAMMGISTFSENSRIFLVFDPKEIECVILSHAHIDHCGRIPLLVKRGFTGKIYCTDATADLLDVMLKDSRIFLVIIPGMISMISGFDILMDSTDVPTE